MGLAPGHYRTLSNEAYHADPSISKSKLDVIGSAAPIHYFDKYLAPDREPHKPTEAMMLGAALHVAVLEPDEFPTRYLPAPEKIDRQFTEGKERWAEFVKEAEGRIVLSAQDYAMIVGQRDAIFRCTKARELLADTVREESYVARDPDTGLMIRARPDVLQRSTMRVSDLKRTIDASEYEFGRAARKYRYAVQGGWYPYVMNLAAGEVVEQFTFICVEPLRPFAVGVYYLTPEQFAAGLARAKRDLQLIAECTRTNHWPDYAASTTELKPLRLSSWDMQQLAEAA